MDLDEMIALMAASLYDHETVYGENAAMQRAVRQARRLWEEVLKPSSAATVQEGTDG